MVKYRLVSHRYASDFQNEMDGYASKGYLILGKIDFYPETTHSNARYVVLMELNDDRVSSL